MSLTAPTTTPCPFCGDAAALLCDGKLSHYARCDRPVCVGCAASSRKRGDTDWRDLCPDCHRLGHRALGLEEQPLPGERRARRAHRARRSTSTPKHHNRPTRARS